MNTTVTTRTGLAMPRLGLGTWHMGEGRVSWQQELAALRRGLDLGLTLLDTAEMYGDGASEELVGEAIKGRRDEVVLVSKVYPWNASGKGMRDACEASLRRLGTERIDLYLLHWPGQHPLEETLDAFRELREAGKIRHFGVSNFDTGQCARMEPLPGGDETAVNQVYYSLGRRGVEWDLLEWCRQRQVALMAYTPLDSGRLVKDAAVRAVAERRRATPSQVALAWLLRRDGVVTIPKASSVEHVEENAGALELRLTDEDLAQLEAAHPAPTGPEPLAVI